MPPAPSARWVPSGFQGAQAVSVLGAQSPPIPHPAGSPGQFPFPPAALDSQRFCLVHSVPSTSTVLIIGP